MQSSFRAEAAKLEALSFRLANTSDLLRALKYAESHLLKCASILQQAYALEPNSVEGRPISKFLKVLMGLTSDREDALRTWVGVSTIRAVIHFRAAFSLQDAEHLLSVLTAVVTNPRHLPYTRQAAILAISGLVTNPGDRHETLRHLATKLPNFISACLHIITSRFENVSLDQQSHQRISLPAILEALGTIVVPHPTIFRPYEKSLIKAIKPFLASTPSPVLNTGPRQYAAAEDNDCLAMQARRLFALLHLTYAGNKARTEWESNMNQIIYQSNATVDVLFRSIKETWLSSTDWQSTLKWQEEQRHDQPLQDAPQTWVLGPWTGVFAGAERVRGLLKTMQAMVFEETPGLVSLPIEAIVDVLIRLMSTKAPNTQLSLPEEQRTDYCSDDERTDLFSILPELHVGGFQFVQTFAREAPEFVDNYALDILFNVCGVAIQEEFYYTVRQEAYNTITALLAVCGAKLDAAGIRSSGLSEVLGRACQDVIPVRNREIMKPEVSSRAPTPCVMILCRSQLGRIIRFHCS